MLFTAQVLEINKYNSPFKSIEYISDDLAYTVVKEDEVENSIHLTDREIEYIPSIRTEKRAKEYTTIRRLAKSFLSKVMRIDNSSIDLNGGVREKPYAVCSNGVIPLSYSHRDGVYAVSFSPNGSVMSGVDVEKFQKINISSFYDFFCDSEIENENENDLIMKWSIKESILKMASFGLSIAASDIKITSSEILIKGRLNDIFESNGMVDLRVWCYMWSDYVASVSFCRKIK